MIPDSFVEFEMLRISPGRCVNDSVVRYNQDATGIGRPAKGCQENDLIGAAHHPVAAPLVSSRFAITSSPTIKQPNMAPQGRFAKMFSICGCVEMNRLYLIMRAGLFTHNAPTKMPSASYPATNLLSSIEPSNTE